MSIVLNKMKLCPMFLEISNAHTTVPFPLLYKWNNVKECLFELFDSKTSEVNVNHIFLFFYVSRKTFYSVDILSYFFLPQQARTKKVSTLSFAIFADLAKACYFF